MSRDCDLTCQVAGLLTAVENALSGGHLRARDGDPHGGPDFVIPDGLFQEVSLRVERIHSEYGMCIDMDMGLAKQVPTGAKCACDNQQPTEYLPCGTCFEREFFWKALMTEFPPSSSTPTEATP